MNSSNEQLLSRAKEIVKKLMNAGSEAYIVGSSLRNLLLDLDNDFLEIYTNHSYDGLTILFSDYKVEYLDSYHAFLGYEGLKYLISFPYAYSFNKKLKVQTTKRHYSKSLMSFLANKDYSIDALAMAQNNVVYDCFFGKEDLSKKRLRMIYDNPRALFDNIPLKMLEAVKAVSETGFKLDKKIIRAIKAKKKKVKLIPRENIAKIMKDIINAKYFKKALKILIKTKLYTKLNLYSYELKKLYNNYRNEEYEIIIGTGMVKEKTYDEVIGATTDNEYLFHMMINLAIVNPQASYDAFTLYSHGLETCLKAHTINLGLKRTKKKTKQIIKNYNALPIKKPCDLAFKGEDVLKITKDNGGEYLHPLMDDIVTSILFGELNNEYNDIYTFVMEKLKEQRIIPDESKARMFQNNNETDDLVEIKKNTTTNNSTNTTIENNIYKEGTTINEFQAILKKQEELEKRVRELEQATLEKELNNEIERRIKESGILDGVALEFKEKTKETLQKVYYETLINSDKYIILKGKQNGQNKNM